MELPTHHREADGYRYVENDVLIGGRVVNTDVDGIYVRVGERKFVVALNGQDHPVMEYGVKGENE